MTAIVQIEIDYKVFRQVMAMLSGDVLTDERILELIGSQPFILNSDLEEFDQLKFAISALILSQQIGDNEKEEKPKSKFRQRLEEAQKRQQS